MESFLHTKRTNTTKYYFPCGGRKRKNFPPGLDFRQLGTVSLPSIYYFGIDEICEEGGGLMDEMTTAELNQFLENIAKLIESNAQNAQSAAEIIRQSKIKA